MKKLIFLLCLCLCLNAAALATQAESAAPAEPAVSTEPTVPAEQPGTTEQPGTVDQSAAQAGEGNGTAPEPNDGKSAVGATQDSAQTPPANGGDVPSDGTSGTNANAPATNADTPATNADTPATSADTPATNADTPATSTDTTPATSDGDGAQPAEDPAAVSAEPAAETPAETTETPAETTETPVEDSAEARFEAASGTLEDLLNQVAGKGTVLLRVDLNNRVYIQAAPLRKLADLTLLPDGEVFKGGDWAVYVSTDEPKGNDKPALVDVADYAEEPVEKTAALYFWVDQRGKYAQAEPTPAPTEAPAPVLSVAAENCTPGQWNAAMPAFTLSGIPEGKAYTYAAIIFDERIVPLSGNTYAPTAQGKYSLRFAMLDSIGDIVSASDTYALWLDSDAPEQVTIEIDTEIAYTMHLTAKDSVSGVEAVSLDGGANWTPLEDGGTFTYTAAQTTTLSPGAIQVRDAAGNIWRSEIAVTLEAVEPEGGYGGGGGGGGSGEKKPTPSHASGDGEEGPEYETVELELPEEPMTRLTVGGETLPLTLVLDAADAEDAPVGEGQPFTAQLRAWCPAPAEDGHENVLADANARRQDTLLLTAVTDENLGDAYTYTWRFNGEVYRMLSNSGVKYVALRVGDDIAAFPTEGFIGGTKYTELKMLGVSTRKFDYTLTMKVNRDPAFVSAMSDSDFSRDCDLSIRAEVENMAYELSGSTNSVMYFYDVYLGPEDMLAQPFGQYRAEQ